jgi:ribosomal-protein-alanine N-acetyltransferase
VTPDALAALHAAAFRLDRPWSAEEFADLLSSPHARLYPAPQGFALTRLVAGEAELLTIAVHPDAQNQGTGRHLLQSWLSDIAPDADTAFLEVAADNAPALHLYRATGFIQVALRAAYYLRKDEAAADALILRQDLTRGQPTYSPLPYTESG